MISSRTLLHGPGCMLAERMMYHGDTYTVFLADTSLKLNGVYQRGSLHNLERHCIQTAGAGLMLHHLQLPHACMFRLAMDIVIRYTRLA